ncbi:MAG: YggT family protein [Anaerolineae bacterium]|jgi:YggT family protein
MSTVATIVSVLFQVYEFLLLIRVLLSWINIDPSRPAIDHPAIQILIRITDPVLAPLRRLIPPIGGTVDISPVVALIILEVVRRILVSVLVGL